MNSMKLKDKLKLISNKDNIDFNALLRKYMYERFIERLSKSRYKDNFILKGGYYLSMLFGINSRYTMDIDLSLKNIELSKENIINIIDEIITIDLKDNITISVEDITLIINEDKYGGYRVRLCTMLDNMKEIFDIDIATGDVITPKEIIYKYNTLFDYKKINLKAYNLETVLAEKLETILSKKELSSRLKDYYDIYLITTIARNNIDFNILINAIENTFKNREFNDDLYESYEIIKNSDILKARWKSYSKKYKYASKITYDDIIKSIYEIIESLELIKK